MSRIAQKFQSLQQQGKKALIPFFTAGDPDKEITVPLLHELVKAGADVIELGVPFSDPMADGPVIQRSSERALKVNTGLKDILAMVAEFRKTNIDTPLVLMGYANPIECIGYKEFCEQAQSAGVDGVLVVDYPPEECEEFAAILKQHKIDPIFLLSPTSSDKRIEQVAKIASGYIYYVSLKGVTGASNIDLSEIETRIPLIKAKCGIPVGVGFGIRDGATARSVSKIADAVVIGSRIVQEIESSPRDKAINNVYQLVHDIRKTMDQ